MTRQVMLGLAVVGVLFASGAAQVRASTLHREGKAVVLLQPEKRVSPGAGEGNSTFDLAKKMAGGETLPETPKITQDKAAKLDSDTAFEKSCALVHALDHLGVANPRDIKHYCFCQHIAPVNGELRCIGSNIPPDDKKWFRSKADFAYDVEHNNGKVEMVEFPGGETFLVYRPLWPSGKSLTAEQLRTHEAVYTPEDLTDALSIVKKTSRMMGEMGAFCPSFKPPEPGPYRVPSDPW